MTNKKDQPVNPTDPTQFKKKRFLKHFRSEMAIVSFACKKVNISRDTFYEWYKNDAWFKKQVEEIKELQIDIAESSLLKNIKKGKERSLIFYLKTKGKHRGWTEQPENPDLDKEYVFRIEIVGKD